jgi:hypothetical protein
MFLAKRQELKAFFSFTASYDALVADTKIPFATAFGMGMA